MTRLSGLGTVIHWKFSISKLSELLCQVSQQNISSCSKIKFRNSASLTQDDSQATFHRSTEMSHPSPGSYSTSLLFTYNLFRTKIAVLPFFRSLMSFGISSFLRDITYCGNWSLTLKSPFKVGPFRFILFKAGFSKALCSDSTNFTRLAVFSLQSENQFCALDRSEIFIFFNIQHFFTEVEHLFSAILPSRDHFGDFIMPFIIARCF